MKTSVFSIIVLIFIGLTSCENHISQILEQADAIIEESPDSALMLINSINPTEIQRKSDKAKYALLSTQAHTKMGVIIYSDSLINEAVDYYSQHGTPNYLMRSLFYKGDISHNRNDLPAAITEVTKAYEIANNLGDYYWNAKTAELMGDIYLSSYNSVEAIHYVQEAIACYDKVGKRDNHLFSTCDLATMYTNIGEFDKGIALIDSVLYAAEVEMQDSTLIAYCYRALFPNHIYLGNYDKARICFDKLLSLKDYYTFTPQYIAYAAQLELKCGNFDQALALIELAEANAVSKSDKGLVYLAYNNLYRVSNRYKDAIEYADSMLNFQNMELEWVLKQAVASSQRDYYDIAAKESEQRATKLRYIMIIGSVISFAIVLIFIIIYRTRMKIKNIELDKKMNEILLLSEQVKRKTVENSLLSTSLFEKENNISNLTTIIEQQKSDIEKSQSDLFALSDVLSIKDKGYLEMEAVIENLFKDKWKMLNILCNEYFEKGASDKTRLSIINDIDDEIKKLQSKKSLYNIEVAVNRYMGDVVSKLRAQCSFLKNDDIVFITLVYAGFSPRAVCLFTGIKLKYYYNKKHRLSERILASDAVDKGLFIAKMAN